LLLLLLYHCRRRRRRHHYHHHLSLTFACIFLADVSNCTARRERRWTPVIRADDVRQLVEINERRLFASLLVLTSFTRLHASADSLVAALSLTGRRQR